MKWRIQNDTHILIGILRVILAAAVTFVSTIPAIAITGEWNLETRRRSVSFDKMATSAEMDG
jgi:hypothetical protein